MTLRFWCFTLLMVVKGCFLEKTEPEAAGAGHKDIVSALRLSKANVDAVDEYGNTVPPAGMGVVFFFTALLYHVMEVLSLNLTLIW